MNGDRPLHQPAVSHGTPGVLLLCWWEAPAILAGILSRAIRAPESAVVFVPAKLGRHGGHILDVLLLESPNQIVDTRPERTR